GYGLERPRSGGCGEIRQRRPPPRLRLVHRRRTSCSNMATADGPTDGVADARPRRGLARHLSARAAAAAPPHRAHAPPDSPRRRGPAGRVKPDAGPVAAPRARVLSTAPRPPAAPATTPDRRRGANAARGSRCRRSPPDRARGPAPGTARSARAYVPGNGTPALPDLRRSVPG